MTISSIFKTLSKSLLLSTAPLAVAACTTVGPDYSGPPETAGQSTARGAFLRAPDETVPRAPAAAWWEQLDDPVLTGLVEEALTNAPSIDVALARVAQARAGLQSARTNALPAIGASASTPYINIPAELVDPESNRDRFTAESLSLGFDASWELDLFGGNRRRVEASNARFEGSRASLADAQVSLSAEVARVYVGLRARQQMKAMFAEQLRIDRQLLAFARQRYKQGTGTLHPVEQWRGQETQTLAEMARNDIEITIAQDQLAVLAGREPGAFDILLAAETPVPLPPDQVAIGSPADMLRLRPDIRQAERNLAAANADIGVNVAELFPKISFIGLLGLGSDSIGDLFDPSRLIGLALPRLSWSAFDGGRSQLRVDASRGAFAEAEANYRAAVLGALADSEAALARFGGTRIAFGQVLEAEAAARRGAALDQMRAEAGAIARSDALAANRDLLRSQMSSTSARAELAEAYIAVNKALGLGWQQAP
ncbi:efflux transporter outer membrane subunit [uncultured Parasphingorhabdus sp.]|uniref:efflux transporter outer membrane subunit n=1 Tax=uncultured Parasphingorhabdus sp. TaxID=2709694 RepID=UPI002AA8695B|nr:efflux transporter outer membrane subunit [uncultured Parasphingorhabdus sp.]